ncbi:MAG: agmatinase [Simkania negevensis]|nr:agmatinase [Simkania negevensis]
MQGHGIPGNFGGLSEECSSSSYSKIVILPVPFDQTTTYQQGADQGPQALIEASRNLELYDIETDSEVYRKGIYTAPAVKQKKSQKMLEAVYEKVNEFLQLGKFVVTLGGEHSISFAPIKAHLEQFGPLSILQFDAHSDLIEAYEGDPYSHASVMARVKELPAVANIVSVGIRSMAQEERAALDPECTFFAHNLYEDFHWVEKVLEKLHPLVYVTFDLDVFDCSLMPSTGTPEPGGLSWHQATKCLREVARRREIVGFDIVELCPIPYLVAPNYLAAKLVYKLLSYIFDQRK